MWHAERLDGFYEENLKIWDYAAGSLLVTEAGGAFETGGPDTMACIQEIRKNFRNYLRLRRKNNGMADAG